MLSFSDDQKTNEEILVFTKRWSALENGVFATNTYKNLGVLAYDPKISTPIRETLLRVESLVKENKGYKWVDVMKIFAASKVFNFFYLEMLYASCGEVPKTLQQLLAVAGFEKDLLLP